MFAAIQFNCCIAATISISGYFSAGAKRRLIYRFFNEMTGFRWGFFGIPMKPDPLFVPSRNLLTSSTKKSTADALPDDTLARFV
jgi:hypothetical protein